MKSAKLKINLLHLLIPLVILVTILSFSLSGRSIFQLELFILFALIYTISTLVHHHKDKSLTLEVMTEYILVAILVAIILTGGLIQI